jgi:hypothetical protein
MPSAVLAIIVSHPRGGLRMTFGVHADYSPFRRLGDLTIDAGAAVSLVRFMQSGDRHYDPSHVAGDRYEMVVHLSIRMAARRKGRTLCTLHVRRDELAEIGEKLAANLGLDTPAPWQRYQHRRPWHHLTSS